MSALRLGPEMNETYVEIGWPVALRGRLSSIVVASASEGTSLSMPAITMCTGGSALASRALPSVLTSITVPVSATQRVRARDPRAGVDEPTPQMPRRRPYQHVRIRRQVFPGGLADQLSRALARDVQRRRDDVRRPFARHLHQELAQIGFNHLDPVAFQRRVELNLLGRHRLALDHHLHVVVIQHPQHRRNGVRRICWPMHDGPNRFRSRRELLDQLGQPIQRRTPPSAQIGLAALEVAKPKGRVAPLAQLR